MKPNADEHGAEHSELLAAYALQSLPAQEIALVERRLSSCSACREELEVLRPVVGSFVGWPTDVLRPPVSLWDRLAERIGADSGAGPASTAPEPWVEPAWEDVAPGIACKLLATDTQRQLVSMLVRLAPGADYPAHRHSAVEELHLLHGELVIDDRKLSPGDYYRALAGSADDRVWSETGCTCVLITSTRDVLG
jgi:anti-sigma factor ChrR (cupin superfamily)